MTLSDQVNRFIEDLTAGTTTPDVLFQRGLFLVGQLDQSGETVNEILALLADPIGRFYTMLGRLGELVGEESDPNAITMGPVIAVAEDR